MCRNGSCRRCRFKVIDNFISAYHIIKCGSRTLSRKNFELQKHLLE
jgi:hypothetical protein